MKPAATKSNGELVGSEYYPITGESHTNMRHAPIVLALMVMLTSPAHGAEARASKGELIFWGNKIKAPYHFVMSSQSFTVNDLGLVISPVTGPRSQFANTGATRARHRLTQSVFATVSQAWEAKLSADAIAQRAIDTLRASPLVDSVKRVGTELLWVEWRAPHGADLFDLHVQPPPPSIEENAASYLRGIVESLDAGYLVIIGAGNTLYVPTARMSETRRELDAIRRDPKRGSKMFPPPLRETLRNPVQLVGRRR